MTSALLRCGGHFFSAVAWGWVAMRSGQISSLRHCCPLHFLGLCAGVDQQPLTPAVAGHVSTVDLCPNWACGLVWCRVANASGRKRFHSRVDLPKNCVLGLFPAKRVSGDLSG